MKSTKKKVSGNWRKALHRVLTHKLTVSIEKAIDEGTFIP
jgi:hypothetical protein